MIYATVEHAQVQGCTGNFPHINDYNNSKPSLLYNRQMLFPSINFTCKGYIKRWIFKGDFLGEQTSLYQFPEPQIWEQVGHGSSGIYKLRASSGFHTIVKPISRTVTGQYVVYTPNSEFPIKFNAGAVLGLLIRSKSANSVLLHFAEDATAQNSNYVYYYMNTPTDPDLTRSFNIAKANKEKIYIPLITIELGKLTDKICIDNSLHV